MARKAKKATRPADAASAPPSKGVVLEAQAQQIPAQTTSGYIGVFPIPKPEPVRERILPKAPELATVKFRGTGQYLARVDGKPLMVIFRNGEYIAKGDGLIEWCRGRGFPEA
jgi:hypothetical protein